MTNELIKIVVRGFYKVAGLDSPYSNREYGPNWSKQRAKALERDNYSCRICGESEEELSRSPSVHHITPRSEYDGNIKQNELENLITLCPSCHGTYEGHFHGANPEEFVARARN